MEQLDEVGRTADTLRGDVEALFVRGLTTCGPSDRKTLEARVAEWDRVGAHHVSSRITSALTATGAKDAPRKLLSAYTSLHGFERILSLEAAKETWQRHLDARATDDGAPASAVVETSEPRASAMPALEDPNGTKALLEELSSVVEDLVRTGLTSATQATRTKLDQAFKEAARRKLLRLGASLRYVNEEIGRFLADDGTFATRRYAFFLHRSWLLARGMLVAIARSDGGLLGSLMSGAGVAPRPVRSVQVVSLGVMKRAVASAYTFDFRLRVTGASDATLVGKSLVFSLVFARKDAGKKGPEIPAEAYLHLPQPQKFLPKLFCEHKSLTVTDCAILPDDRGGGRLVLGPKSSVTQDKKFTEWAPLATWDAEGARRRAESHVCTPLDLAVELQEEIVLPDWRVARADDGGLLLGDDAIVLRVALPPGDAGVALTKTLEAGSDDGEHAPIYGTVHYEFGRVVFSPLAYLEDDGPKHLLLSNEDIDLPALMSTLNLG